MANPLDGVFEVLDGMGLAELAATNPKLAARVRDAVLDGVTPETLRDAVLDQTHNDDLAQLVLRAARHISASPDVEDV